MKLVVEAVVVDSKTAAGIDDVVETGYRYSADVAENDRNVLL